MVASIIFLVLLGTLIGKLVYDHQLSKELNKIEEYSSIYEIDEDLDQNIY
jgi:hypothetical protein